VTRPIKAAINRRSKRKFDEFWFALQTVGDALLQAEQLAAKLPHHRTGGPTGGRGGARASNGVGGRLTWSAASPEELKMAAKKAHNSLRVMATTANGGKPNSPLGNGDKLCPGLWTAPSTTSASECAPSAAP
jgi:hypothetical protein